MWYNVSYSSMFYLFQEYLKKIEQLIPHHYFRSDFPYLWAFTCISHSAQGTVLGCSGLLPPRSGSGFFNSKVRQTSDWNLGGLLGYRAAASHRWHIWMLYKLLSCDWSRYCFLYEICLWSQSDYLYINIYVWLCIYIYMCVWVCDVYIYIYMYIYIYKCIFARVRILRICIYTYIYIYIYIYIYTHLVQDVNWYCLIWSRLSGGMKCVKSHSSSRCSNVCLLRFNAEVSNCHVDSLTCPLT